MHPTASPAPNRTTVSKPNTPRILIADDDRELAGLLADYLRSLGPPPRTPATDAAAVSIHLIAERRSMRGE